jgi:hypothetical protein
MKIRELNQWQRFWNIDPRLTLALNFEKAWLKAV